MDMKNPEIIRTQDGSNFRISDDLNEMNETRGDELDFCKPLGVDKIDWGMLLANFYTRMKSCWLFMIKNIGMKFEPSLIITTVAPSIYKSYMLCSNILYFRLLNTADLEDGVRRRIAEQRSKPAVEEMSLLLTHAGEKVWGEKRIGNKVAMVGQIVGFQPRINTGKDQMCMQRYITRVSKTGLDMPTMLTLEQFLPAGLHDF